MANSGFISFLAKLVRKRKQGSVDPSTKLEMGGSCPVHSDEPKGLFDSEEERLAAIEKARQELRAKAEQEDATYDPANDPEVCQLLQSLSIADRSEFFRVREQSIHNRKSDETLSQRELDILTLQAMKHSSSRTAVAPKENGSCNLSYPEIVLLAKLDKKALNSYIAPGYFTYDYHLDLNASIDSFFENGLIAYADFKTCLEGMTVKELKEILEKSGLAISGKKSALVDRIITNCNPAVWEKRIDRRVMLTDVGRELVTKYDVLIVCQNNSGVFSVSLDEAGSMREQYPEWSAYQIIRFVLDNRSKKHLAECDYGLYRNCLFGISETHRFEGNLEKQKHYLLQCCFMDAIGYANGGAVEERLAILAPGLISRLAHIYRDNAFALAEDYQQALKVLPIPRTPDYEMRASNTIREALVEQGCG